ncbi:hypothetical protein ABFZ85_09425 [Hyphococcus formosus]|uniref:hypothetical protein n=1 Tax=Hyphococcus formosus TaxID=3143534 RepID=UPI00398A9060
MEIPFEWNVVVEFFADHIFQLVIGGGTTATAFGVFRVRKMLVEQMNVQTIVFSEAAGQQLAAQLSTVNSTILIDELVSMYREVLNRLHFLTAPHIDNNVAAQLTVKLKTVSALFSRAMRDKVISQSTAGLFTELESLLQRLILDLVSAGRKSYRHATLVSDANELVNSLLRELGDADEERLQKITDSNIMPKSNVLFRFLFSTRPQYKPEILF